ncbi:MAG: hypothetical protein V4501_11305 [Pseudomonadota bacterium]
MKSNAIELGDTLLPTFEGKVGDSIYMLPFLRDDISNIPDKYKDLVQKIMGFIPYFIGKAYLTVDQKLINKPGKRHRRGGLHVDGNYVQGGWGGDSGGWLNGISGIMNTPQEHQEMYLTEGMGTILASDYPACQVWSGEFNGEPSHGGNCDHLRDELADKETYILTPNKLYWLTHGCVHESMPIEEVVKRTLIRVTLPIK